MDDRIPREEVEAFLEVRREQGNQIEPALIDSMTAKIEGVVRRRYQAELQSRTRHDLASKQGQGARLTVAIISLVMAIPLTAISSGMGLAALLIVWAGIVAVNIAFALRRPPHDE